MAERLNFSGIESQQNRVRVDSVPQRQRLATQMGVEVPRQRLGEGIVGYDKTTAFVTSAIESFPELFGIEPSKGTQKFRADNPVSGFASQAVGAFVPYLGAAKAVRMAPVVGNAIRGAEAFGTARAGALGRFALGGMAEAAAVETLRVGIGASGVAEGLYEGLTGREATMRGTGDLVTEGLMNIGMAGVGGAAIGGLVGRFSRPTALARFDPDLAPDRNMNTRLRTLNRLIGDAQNPDSPVNFPEPELERLVNERNTLVEMNLEGAVPKFTSTGEAIREPGMFRRNQGTRVFRPIVRERRGGEQSNFLNRVSNWRGSDRTTETRRFVVSPDGKGAFTSERELNDALSAVGVTRENLAMNVTDAFVLRAKSGVGKRADPRLPAVLDLPGGDQTTGQRLLTNEPPPKVTNVGKRNEELSKAETIQKKLSGGKAWAKIGNGWNMANEAGEDGMFVLSKKIKGDPNMPAPGDEWAVLRTDNPGVFDPQSAKLQKQMLESGYYPIAEDKAKIGSALWDSVVDFGELAKGNRGIERVGKSVKPTKLGRAQAMAGEIADKAGNYLAPSAPGAARNQIANGLMQTIKSAEAFVDAHVDKLMRGTRLLDTDTSAGRQVLSFKEVAGGGIAEQVEGLTDDAIQEIQAVLEFSIPVRQLDTMVHRGLLSPQARDFLKQLDHLDGQTIQELEKISEHVTSDNTRVMLENFHKRSGHYGVSRENYGQYRYLLQDGKGNIVGVAAGASPDEAIKYANDLVEAQRKRGKTIYRGGLIDEGEMDAASLMRMKAAVRQPGFMKQRSELIGDTVTGKALTKRDLSRLVEANLKRRWNYLRDITLAEQTAGDLATLERQNPDMAAFIRKRLAILQGDEGDFARAQNQIMDKALSMVGLSGKNSASNIVRVTQKTLADFQFGFGNIVNPIQNLMGVVQTVLPEIAYTTRMNAAIADNYVSLPVFDGENRMVGSIGMLSDIKLFNTAIKHAATPMHKLDPAHVNLIERMIQERYLAPRFAEEQFGLNSAILSDVRNAWKSPADFVEFFGAANRVLVTKSEEMNRLVAINAAYEVAKLRNMSEGQMVAFTREFLSKTAFNYGTVDRATTFTTPVGSLMGTFKNWTFHYVANMFKYAGGGKEALPALFWQTASTALIGGAAATPFAMPLIDGASKWLTNDSAMENLYNAVGQDGRAVADGLLYGLPATMGLSLSSYVAAPMSDPERDASMMFSFVAADRMRALGAGTKNALAAYVATGESPFNDPLVRDNMTRALAPRTIYRAMSVNQDNAVRSMMNGNNIAMLSPGQALGYAAGFNPTELEKTYEVYSMVRDSQEKKKTLVTTLGRRMADALEAGDSVEAEAILKRATIIGVDTSSVLRSAKARQKIREGTMLTHAASDEDKQNFDFMFEEE